MTTSFAPDLTLEPELEGGGVVYWHRELPPLDAAIIGEHTLEATSVKVYGSLECRDDLWQLCYDSLMANAESRFQQEIARLDGDYAHVFDEAITSCHDEATNRAWLRGRFSYMLYQKEGRLV
jgi:hypothetical protein